MLSGILNSDIAVAANIQIMRAFVKLRHYTLSQPDTNDQIAMRRGQGDLFVMCPHSDNFNFTLIRGAGFIEFITII